MELTLENWKTELNELATKYHAKEGNGAGGLLHIVLDDGNTDDSCIYYCLNKANISKDIDAIEICNRLLKLKKWQRNRFAVEAAYI